MAPNISTPTGVLYENDNDMTANVIPLQETKPSDRKLQLVWKNIILMSSFHVAAIYGVYLMFTSAKLATSILAYFLYLFGGFGITAGVHRLWAHKTYKANVPLRILLTVLNTIVYESSIISWTREHRLHHKYSDTDADPHNSNRGFFFCHVGWLLCRKHPEVKRKGKTIDLSDLYEDRIIVFQDRYYAILMPLGCFILPTLAPMYFWNETFVNAFCINMFRFVFTLNATWLVNSAAHFFGDKPYEKYINSTENLGVSIVSLGEGWHNYHHVFPWDYKTSELGKYSTNFTTAFIDIFAKIGWAYELKTVSEDMIKKRVLRTGDGTHGIWGWGDKDQPKEDYDDALITYKR